MSEQILSKQKRWLHSSRYLKNQTRRTVETSNVSTNEIVRMLFVWRLRATWQVVVQHNMLTYRQRRSEPNVNKRPLKKSMDERISRDSRVNNSVKSSIQIKRS